MTRSGSMTLTDLGSRIGSRANLGSRNSLSSSAPPPRHHVLERTLCIIKADAYAESPADEEHTEVLPIVLKPKPRRIGKEEIIKAIFDNGFTIIEQKEVTIFSDLAKQLSQDDTESSNYDEIIESYTKGPSYLVVLEKGSAINSWKELIGPASPAVAKERAPQSYVNFYF